MKEDTPCNSAMTEPTHHCEKTHYCEDIQGHEEPHECECGVEWSTKEED